LKNEAIDLLDNKGSALGGIGNEATKAPITGRNVRIKEHGKEKRLTLTRTGRKDAGETSPEN